MDALFVENLNIREIAAPVYLTVRENLNVVFIDKVDRQKPIWLWDTICGTVPIHCVGIAGDSGC
jgi:hypothetical protein